MFRTQRKGVQRKSGRFCRTFRRISLFLIFTFLLIVFMGDTSQAAIYDRRNLLGRGEDYTSILYDSSNGLPTPEANAIAQSPDGFIWIGGYSGLIRYDGTQFSRFDSSTGISSVFSLYVDTRERVWIGTNENGVAYYDHGKINVYGRTEGLKSYSIRSMTEDNDGNILIATTLGMAYAGEDLQIHVIDDPQINMEYITKLYKDGEGKIYGLTLSGGVFTVENLRITSYYDSEEFGEDLVNCIFPDPDRSGILHMGTTDSEILTVDIRDGLKVLDRKNVKPLKNINSILRIGKITWLTATNGIGYLDENGKFSELKDIPMNNSIGNIMQDHEGNIWFTSTRQGVMKLVSDRFTDLSRYLNLDTGVVNATCLYHGKLYLATDSGVMIIDGSTDHLVENELTRMLDGIRVRCVKKDSRDNLWFCTHGDYGLVCYKKDKSIVCFNESNGLDANRIRTVLERKDGSMAVATAGNGAFIVENGEVTKHYGKESGIQTSDILSMEEDWDGRLYLGSDGGGVYVVDGNKVSRIGYEDGLTSEVVLRIKRDDVRKMMWIITSNSISYQKDGVITPIKQFPYSNNYDIFFNKSGGAWILSSNGLYVTKVSELLDGGTVEYSFYNTKSGLPYTPTGNSRSYMDEYGKLYIAGTTGVCRVNINSEKGNNENVKLAIPSVEIDDNVIPARGGQIISIPAGSRRLVFDAYALTYGLNNPRICYYLEGFDKEKIYTTKQDMQPVVYTNLDGGRYTFHMEVLNDETGEADKSMMLTIVKETSLYENIYFWICLMLGAVIVISLCIWRYFMRKTAVLIEKQEEDQKFINQIMHTFAKCIDLRDSQNRGHSFRVAYYTRMLAGKLKEKRGYTDEQINGFYNIALLHDIGKLSIPDAILNKTSRLDDEEYAVMKSHAVNGEKILKEVNIVKDLAVGAGYHHERIDGKGYPRGLRGEKIPEVAKIIAVADAFDAMYSTRPYRKQMLITDVLAEIQRIRGTQLDEDVVDALMKLYEENELDKEKVDAATAYRKEDIEVMNEEDKNREEETAKQNEEFLKSLGLYQEPDKK